LIRPLVHSPFSDIFATEIAWALVAVETKETVASRPYGFYHYENEVRELVQLKPGKEYAFTMKDVYGDGIEGKGYYQIFTTDGNVLLRASGLFGREAVHHFKAPELP
jgi:hypothetical protein